MLVFALLFAVSSAHAQNLPQGTYRCYPPENPNQVIVRGYCKYQVKDNGLGFSALLRLAQKLVNEWPGGTPASPNNVDPIPGPGDKTIMWWFDNQDANDALGKALQKHDIHPEIILKPTIVISATMYSFEQGTARDLGFNVGSFYGSKPEPETEQPLERFVGNIASGIFNVAGNIGNPLASFLSLGVEMSRDRKQAETIHDVIYSCENGETCDYRRSRTIFILANTGTEKPDIGLSISATPRADLTALSRGLVLLEGLSMNYSVATGIPTEPVEEFKVMNNRDLTVRTDQIYVLSSDNMRMDIRTGRVFGRGVKRTHSQFLILMKVSVNLPEDMVGSVPIPQFQHINGDRSLTASERAALPNGELSLKEVFGSIQVACFKDQLNPSNAEKICGFQFGKMDRTLADQFVKFNVKGDLRPGYPKARESVQRASDFLKSKGYYQLPRLRNDRPGNFTLEVELDKSNPISRRTRNAQEVYGLKVPFGYYPNTAEPILFDSRLIQWKQNYQPAR